MISHPISVADTYTGASICRDPIRATTPWRALHTARILHPRRDVVMTIPGHGTFRLAAGDALPREARFDATYAMTRG